MGSIDVSDGDLCDSRANLVVAHLQELTDRVRPFIAAADTSSTSDNADYSGCIKPPNQFCSSADLEKLTDIKVPAFGSGTRGMFEEVEKVLKYSVNTWDRGFMDKLTSSTDSPGIVSETLLAVLNTNVHVYNVSPVLTLIERHVTRELCHLFGLNSNNAGGISQPGGSASNQASLVIARNTKFPHLKSEGLQCDSRRYIIFTSQHCHYSVQKAAQLCGLGTRACRFVPADSEGRMSVPHLQAMIQAAKDQGETPFYVNATAGTTVLGAFDPLREIGELCRREGLWFHVDASWGGSFVFSERLRRSRLDGTELADSITMTPHKMMGVPMTCSFLLGRDVRLFKQAYGVDAPYLFHDTAPGPSLCKSPDSISADQPDSEIYDLGQLSSQCGRKGDALKLYLGWTYYGSTGYSAAIERAHSIAQNFADTLVQSPHISMVSKLDPLSCLQVCFYWGKDGVVSEDHGVNEKISKSICHNLRMAGWMIDFAPGPKGAMIRVVIGRETTVITARLLFEAIQKAGELVVF